MVLPRDDHPHVDDRGREEPLIGLCTIFYPMGRIERLERDDALGTLPSYAERFEREVGRTVFEVLGVGGDGAPGEGARRRKRVSGRSGRPH